MNLWNFSVKVYGTGEIARECLSLQERFGIDVNLLLLCAFYGSEGKSIPASDVKFAMSYIAPWHNSIVRSLRLSRTNLKTILTEATYNVDGIQSLRTTVMTAELASEKIEQSILFDWATKQSMNWTQTTKLEALYDNIRLFLTEYGAGGDQADPRLVLPELFNLIASSD